MEKLIYTISKTPKWFHYILIKVINNIMYIETVGNVFPVTLR